VLSGQSRGVGRRWRLDANKVEKLRVRVAEPGGRQSTSTS
jgi:hypothetical protein